MEKKTKKRNRFEISAGMLGLKKVFIKINQSVDMIYIKLQYVIEKDIVKNHEFYIFGKSLKTHIPAIQYYLGNFVSLSKYLILLFTISDMKKDENDDEKMCTANID